MARHDMRVVYHIVPNKVLLVAMMNTRLTGLLMLMPRQPRADHDPLPLGTSEPSSDPGHNLFSI